MGVRRSVALARAFETPTEQNVSFSAARSLGFQSAPTEGPCLLSQSMEANTVRYTIFPKGRAIVEDRRQVDGAGARVGMYRSGIQFYRGTSYAARYVFNAAGGIYKDAEIVTSSVRPLFNNRSCQPGCVGVPA